MKKHVELDLSELLGYRLAAASEQNDTADVATDDSRLGAKVGSKTGNKIGSKIGVKNVPGS